MATKHKGNPAWVKKEVKFSDRTELEKKEFLFILKRKTNSSTISEHKGYTPLVLIAGTGNGLWLNPETKELEQKRVRHVPFEKSIWVHEQAETTKDTDAKSISFEDGLKRVTSYEKITLEYLRVTQHSSNLFEEYNSDKKAIAYSNKDQSMVEAKALIYDFFKTSEGIEMMFLYAETIGENTNVSPAELKAQLLYRAGVSPDLFLSDLANPLLKKKAKITMAIKEGVIHIQGNTVQFDDNKPIFTCAINSDTINEFVEHCHNTVEGQKIFETIIKKIEQPLSA
jgi:hypothetical protein